MSGLCLRFPDIPLNPDAMYIIPIAWLYVALMMAVAEATASNGSVLGALVTFVLYGLLPIALMLYFMGTPARRRAIRAQEAAQNRTTQGEAPLLQPNDSGLAPTDAVAPVREKP